jgi:LuxR family maltose regulon positive regulatory protein
MASFAAQAKPLLGAGQSMLESSCQLGVALADWLRGRLADAERGFADLVARWRSVPENSLASGSGWYLGQVQQDQGRLDAAFRTYADLVAIAENGEQPRLAVAGYGYVGMAEIAYQRDELADALRFVSEGIARCRQLSQNEPLASGLIALAWIRQAEGDQAGAVAAIEEAERIVPGPAAASMLNPIPVQRARLLLAQGDRTAAARWVSERSLGLDDQPSCLREQEYLLLVRLLLAQGQGGGGLALLDRMHGLAVQQDRTGRVIELLALRALALAAAGDRPGAASALTEALRLAGPRGYVRVFADEGAAMATLLGQVQQDGRPGQGLVDPLTVRELEVLALLAAGTPNQGIADQLVVTLDTVKKHVTHVLAKLGAGNRTEAVARARQIGLIG